MRFLPLIIIFALAAILPCEIYAQKEGNVWYFGNKAGISFNTSPPEALTDGALSTLEGCATISNAQGKLLFYTDGIRVWNRLHEIMPNGNDLAGNPSSTQSGIIVPKPLHTNIYYVFTVDKEALAKGLQYSEVDISLNNGLGNVTVKNQFLIAPVAEKLTAVQHANKKDIWVICHEWQSENFRAYLVTETGVSTTPVISKSGFWHGGQTNNSIGYLKASPDGRFLAGVIRRETMNVELFDFDNATGLISKKLTITGIKNPYGVEFSPDVTKLYTGSVNLDQLYQIDLAAGDSNAINASKTLIAEMGGIFNLTAFQLGPDGKIYVSRAGSTKLSVINQPNLKGKNCNYDPQGIDLKGKSCQNGLPTFIQSYFIPLTGFNYDMPCLGETTTFYGLSNTIPDSWHWNFGDIASGDKNESGLQNPTHIFTKAGRYKVSLTIGKADIFDTVIKYIDVQLKPKPGLGKDMLLCIGEVAKLDAGAGLKYTWSTGDSTREINVTETGKYWVQVNNLGCTGSDTINVRFIEGDELKLGNDTTLCIGSSLKLESKIPGAKYLWVNGSRDSAITVTKTGSYWLQTVVGECSVTDTVFVNFIPPPALDLGPDSIVCEGDKIVLDAKNPGATYLWSTGEESREIEIRKGGTYWVEVSGGDCSASDTITFTPCRSKVFVPNAFTPDKNGLNDSFRVFGTDIFLGKLTIANRWGQIIFQTTDIFSGWDGKYKGKKCPPGQYIWSLHYWEYEGKILYPKIKKGAVTIL